MDPQDYPRDAPVHALFLAAAAATPDAVALRHAAGTVSYGALAADARRIAAALAADGVGSGDLVAVLTERGPAAIAAFIGILAAGAAYVPLDPAYPAEALEAMLGDADPPRLLVQRALADRFPGLVPPHGAVRVLEELLADAPPVPALPAGAATDLAYVMYTSGSTGTPKGVRVPHRAVVRLVRGQRYARFAADEVFLHLSPLAFDASTFEIWGALLNGGSVAIVGEPRPGLADIGAAIARHGATTAWFTAALFHLMVEHRLEELRPLRRIVTGGDVVSPGHAARALAGLPGCRLVNGYGPTENTTFTTAYDLLAEGWDGGALPIGRPLAHGRVAILDEDLAPVADGEVGQLCCGGDGLADGYLRRPELTASKFVADPARPGERLYLTGDLARRRPDGVIEFLGRLDRQVKINGKRVELDEIEHVLRADPALADAIVVMREDRPGMKRLAAYLKPATAWAAERCAAEAAGVIRRLRRKLPEHMIPADVVVVEAFALTPNGKVDRKALPPPPAAAPAAPALAADSPTERAVALIWQRVLALPTVPAKGNFFDLGGTSLQIIAVHDAIEQETGRRIPIASLFEHPTVAGLAAFLDDRADDGAVAAARLRAARQGAALGRFRRSRPEAAE
ncbi:MAG TPA: non-ribosomal peptide synthetase [Hyphomicrobiales bacterium]|nr:non-ribosomal peptide synthetase [Hyphomicrobiales bacterium]